MSNSPVLLHIESSSITCGVAVSIGAQVVAEFAMHKKNVHSQKLAPLVERVLAEADISIQQVEGIALSAGPGSFTGLRIGFSLAKGIAHAQGIPIMPISTLKIWAYQAGPRSGIIVPIIDARRGEIFVAQYRWQAGQLEEVVSPTLLPIEQLPRWLPEGPILLTGSDAGNIIESAELALPPGVVYQSAPYLQLWALARLGIQAFEQNTWVDVATVEPIYMRAFKGVQ